MAEGGRTLPHTEMRPLPVLVHAERVHQASSGGHTSTSDDNAEPTSWRALAAQIYDALGSPALPGYTRQQVHRVLAGTMALEPGFGQALLGCYRASLGDAQEQLERTPGRRGLGRLLRRPARVSEQTCIDTGRTASRSSAIDAEDVSAPRRADGGESRDAIVCDNDPREAAPFPYQAASAAQFAAGLCAVKQWSGLSLRQLEQRARQEGSWLPRSSISDMLRRESIPKADALDALMRALGLSSEERDRWQALRDAIACSGKRLESEESPTLIGGPTDGCVGPGPDRVQAASSSWRRRLTIAAKHLPLRSHDGAVTSAGNQQDEGGRP